MTRRLLAILLLASCSASSQLARRVKDINGALNRQASSDPGELVARGEIVYFTATDGIGFRLPQLWRSDGTAAGTRVVRSFNQPPKQLVVLNNILFFVLAGEEGYELWKSDGTANGTRLVKDILPGIDSSFPSHLTNVGGTLYFSACSIVVDFFSTDCELWKSDGTAAGTVRVKDIVPGTGGSTPSNMADVNGVLYFSACSVPDAFSPSDCELWKSDGTAVGTVRVKDIVPGLGSSHPANMVNVGGLLYFSACSIPDDFLPSDCELWKSNGTGAGTIRVKDINSGAESALTLPLEGAHGSAFANVNGTLFFQACSGEFFSDCELWKSDGTDTGTLRVEDIAPGGASSSPFWFAVRNTILYFAASGDSNGDRELWRSDGTETGTFRIRDIQPGLESSNPQELTLFDGLIYFSACGPGGCGLWKSDGSNTGTTEIKKVDITVTFGEQVGSITVASTRLFFSGCDRTFGCELWASNGSRSRTNVVKDINPGAGSSDPDSLSDLTGILLFRAISEGDTSQLWRSGGREQETRLVKDFGPGFMGRTLGSARGNLFFVATDGPTGTELWKSDGTPGGTLLVKDIHPGFGSGLRGEPALFHDAATLKGSLYFAAQDPQAGLELWKSDGTEAGTVRIKDISLGSASSQFADFTVSEGYLYFMACLCFVDCELWRTDGTGSGTILVKDIVPGPTSSTPLFFTDLNGTLFFAASHPSFGRELWKSDGTPAGTVLVKDIVPGPGSSVPSELVNVGGILFFSACSIPAADGLPERDCELWKSDGTAAGTVLVKDINPGPGSSFPLQLTSVAGSLFFSACQVGLYPTGRGIDCELWRSNGTAAGTSKAKDINRGEENSYPQHLLPLGDSLLFTAYSPLWGREIWKSDAGSRRTTLLDDIAPGAPGSDPRNLTVSGQHVFFSAFESSSGRELWALPLLDRYLPRPGFVRTLLGVDRSHPRLRVRSHVDSLRKHIKALANGDVSQSLRRRRRY